MSGNPHPTQGGGSGSALLPASERNRSLKLKGFHISKMTQGIHRDNESHLTLNSICFPHTLYLVICQAFYKYHGFNGLTPETRLLAMTSSCFSRGPQISNRCRNLGSENLPFCQEQRRWQADSCFFVHEEMDRLHLDIPLLDLLHSLCSDVKTSSSTERFCFHQHQKSLMNICTLSRHG